MDTFSKFTLRILCALLFWVISPDLYAQIGGLDMRFNPLLDGPVNATAAQSDGKVVIAGEFTSVNGTPRGRVARLNSDGTLDSGFATNLTGANATVWCMALQSDGKIVIGGDFDAINGTGRNRIARLNADGTLDSSFDPGAGANGTVYAVGLNQSKGWVVIGGDFTTVNGTVRNRIAQLRRSNGSLDPATFNGSSGGANATVYAIAVDGGSYYIGGAFTTVSGAPRNRIAQVNESGSLGNYNTGATAGPNGTVYSVVFFEAAFAQRVLLVGGDFTTVGGVSHPRLAVFDSLVGLPDRTFNFSADGAVRCCSVQTEPSSDSYIKSKIVIGGDFGSINGTACVRVARIARTGSSSTPWLLDTSYNTGAGADASLRCMAAQSDGKTFIGGLFTSVDGNSRSGFARLNGDGGSIPPATPAQPATGAGTDTRLVLVWSEVSYISGYRIERSPDGVNNWIQVNPATLGSPANPYIDTGLSPGTTYYYRVKAFSTNGDSLPSPVATATTLSTPWTKAGARDPSFIARTGFETNDWINSIYTVAPQPDGKILVGGSSYLARLHSDGSADSTFSRDSAPNSFVRAIAVQSDGKVVIGGDFSSVRGAPIDRIARLNTDGSLDTTFAPSPGADTSVKAVAIQPDGKILIAGWFRTVNGVSRDRIARLNANGSLDSSFSTSLSYLGGYSLAIQPDGKILVAGSFQSVNGVTRGSIARLHSDGTLDTSFAQGTGANGLIESMQLQPDGRIVIAGEFDQYDGTSRKGVARLQPDGSLDPTFEPGSGVENGVAHSVVVQSDEKVILGGSFTVVRGAAQLRLTRFNADGTLDSSFVPGLGMSGDVQALGIQPDGKCIVGGLFTGVNGVDSRYLTRLSADNGTNAPTPPQNPGAAVFSSNSVRLTWQSVAFVSGYKIFYSADGVSSWSLVTALPAGTTSFIVMELTSGAPAYFRIRAYNTNGDSADSPMVTATTYSAYQQWKLDNDLPLAASDLADPDGDGIPNLMEYALGSHPRVVGLDTMPVATLNGSILTLTYSRLRTDVLYTVEVSTDLVSWSTDGVDQGGTGSLVTASTPLGTGARKFLRLRISVP